MPFVWYHAVGSHTVVRGLWAVLLRNGRGTSGHLLQMLRCHRRGDPGRVLRTLLRKMSGSARRVTALGRVLMLSRRRHARQMLVPLRVRRYRR
jgi:hypothetical protein